MSGATAINCTQCGAGLDVLGGGRVRAHVCGYCGAELDAQDNYKVLRQFKDMKRPESPFQIGMEGEIDGVAMVVIGTIGREEKYRGSVWQWTEHQLFSPTHGYAWLSWENGNITFTRKTRNVPNPDYLTSHAINVASSRPKVWLGGSAYTYYSSGQSQISFVEGEFNWIPELGDANRYVSLLGDHDILTIAGAKQEREYELTTLLNRQAVLKSFGINPGDVPAPRRAHPLAISQQSPTVILAKKMAFVCAALCLVLALVMSFVGTEIATARAASGERLKVPFEVTDETRLVQVNLSASVDNSWASLEAEIVDEEDEPVSAFERGIEYYHGYDDGHWSEGSDTASVCLRLGKGKYYLNLAMAEADPTRTPSVIGVVIWQGVVSTFWLWLGLAVFLLIGIALLILAGRRRNRRLAGSDWDDD